MLALSRAARASLARRVASRVRRRASTFDVFAVVMVADIRSDWAVRATTAATFASINFFPSPPYDHRLTVHHTPPVAATSGSQPAQLTSLSTTSHSSTTDPGRTAGSVLGWSTTMDPQRATPTGTPLGQAKRAM